MLRLVNPSLLPPGGFYFTDPDTGFVFNLKYNTFADLEQHVANYRKQNNLEPIPELRRVWENWVCQGNPRPPCTHLEANIQRNFVQYLKGGKMWMKTKLLGYKSFVRKEIAESRAKICSDCQENLVNIAHRHAQAYTDGLMLKEVGGRKTSLDTKLFTCRLCTCVLRAKVHYRSGMVAEGLSQKLVARLKTIPKTLSGKPLRCWQLTAYEKITQGESDEGEIEESSKSSVS